MTLRYIALYIDSDAGISKEFQNAFNYNTRFIGNYLSKKIRPFKVKTDGTFNMIAVAPSKSKIEECKIVGDKALLARVRFDAAYYNGLGPNEKNEYYLQLLELGYSLCGKNKTIPIEVLLDLHNQFRAGDYKNEWLHKKKKFKEEGIEVFLKCFFTSEEFRLEMLIIDLTKNKEVASGVVLRTEPDEVHFDRLFKDVKIEGEKLIITEYLDRPKFEFRLGDLRNGQFSYTIKDVGLHYKG